MAPAAFIGDIIDAVGDVANDIVIGVDDAANAVVDVATQVAHVANVAVQDVQNVIDATQEAINVVTHVADATAELADEICNIFADFGFIQPADEIGGQAQAAPSAASVAQLIQSRRRALRQRNLSVRNQLDSQKRQLRNAINELAGRARGSSRSDSGL